jgi:hypothetical protein
MSTLAQSNQSGSFLRVSMDGLNGSGKTCTIAQLALGIAKEYARNGPVHVFDSSDRWPAWKLLMFDVEKIPLVITYGTTLAALQESIDRAVREKCAVFVADDLTVPWMEGVSAFARENGAMPFDRRQQLVNQWNRFVGPFQLGEFDSLACGRLGYVWETIEDEHGDEKLHQGDSKFNAGGGANFGYDCVLELEMRRRKRRLLGLFRGKTTVEYVCDVIKDANGTLNAEQFVFEDFGKKGYQPGDYRKVLDKFRPHIEFRRRLERSYHSAARTGELLISGKTSWAKDQTERKSLLEEFSANLDMAFPSGEGKSKLAKMFRDLTLEYLNGFISWSRMEEEVPTVNLERNVLIARALRERVEGGEIPTNQTSLNTLLTLATEDVLHPGKNMTLLEAMGKKSVESITSGRRSQAGD